MSEGREERTKPLEDNAAVAGAAEHTVTDGSAIEGKDEADGAAHHGQHHDLEQAMMPSNLVAPGHEAHQSVSALAEGTNHPLLDVSDITEEDSQRARDIERLASEHLARRAAMMDSGGEETAETQQSDPTNKHDLPTSPTPPVPPCKDGEKQDESPEIEYDEKQSLNDEPVQDFAEAPQGMTETTGLEIQTIMDQFEHGFGDGEQDIMSPRLEKQQPAFVLPPRSSSLEAQHAFPVSPQDKGRSVTSQHVLDRNSTPPTGPDSSSHQVQSDDTASITSIKAGSIFQPPPPSSEPEVALPFDFHRFLEQLRHRTADPVARFLRSFLSEFGKKQWMVHEQVKIISDFLEFIAKKMAQCEVWRTVSDAEFDNAREGMEKLVMNRLYSQTFSPAIPSAAGSPRKGARNARSPADVASPHGPGRRGQHQEDVERDEVIAQKMRIYGWIREEHLDVKPIGEKGKKFLGLAQQELLKINTYRAPRDKVICVLNTCKVIFGFLKNAKADQSADSFVPLLIYTVLQARPEHLVSNVQYIWRFRNQDKLGGEAGYYMSSLMGVVSFIENLDRTNLTISDEEFERNVEQAVSAIAEENKEQEYEEKTHVAAAAAAAAAAAVRPMQHISEKSTLSRAEVTPRNSQEAERSSPRRNVSQRLSEKNQPQQSPSTNSDDDDTDAMSGLLRTIQKPLSSIGRIFSDDSIYAGQQSSLKPANTPQPAVTPRRLSPAPQVDRMPSADIIGMQRRPDQQQSAEAEAARQASAEAAQAQKMRVREHKVVVETLQSMFPNLDQEVIEDVTRAQEGNVGKAVDACLALSG
ncbi:vacuolar sorting protein 9-like protein [Teratosphaeria destructans]|uniref:Vacuolar sorting protein 9-like protein n=1 Tax=Teratosphaeria destructans TaxID=418781 RepID=A0A9W7W6K7_9PEZI|nr:vacuolar sorting protein 9-like protein [Teratosphaeria destructans]